MADILTFPKYTPESPAAAPRYADRLKTAGDHWVRLEKRLLDKAEFLEAMILVLDDVKLTNIRHRDYAMMEIVSDEIPLYQKRLEEVQDSLAALRRDYHETLKTTNIMAN